MQTAPYLSFGEHNASATVQLTSLNTNMTALLAKPAPVPSCAEPERSARLLGQPLQAFLEHAHPELVQAISAAGQSDAQYVEITPLPAATRRMVWGLIETHYPDLAIQIRSSMTREWRERLNATFSLNVGNLIDALERSYGSKRSPAMPS
jgi:hypothetical protein